MSRDGESLVGQVEEALRAEPSAPGWYALCNLFDAWEGSASELTAALALAEERLEGWPDALRRGRPAWVFEIDVVDTSDMWGRSEAHSYRAIRQQPSPAWGLARSAWTGLRDEVLAALVPELEGLRALDVSGNHLGAAGVSALTAGGSLPETLDVTRNPLGDAGVSALVGSGALQGRATLGLSHTGLGPNGARVLAAAADLASLRRLDVSFNQIGDEGAAALATSPRDEGARALASSPVLAALTDLDLRANGLGAEGERALRTSLHLKRLERLDT